MNLVAMAVVNNMCPIDLFFPPPFPFYVGLEKVNVTSG